MNIETFTLGPFETNAYLVWNEQSKEAILIDAPHGAWEIVMNFVQRKGLKLQALIITHGHADHVADARKFQNAGVAIYAHQADKSWIEDPRPLYAWLPPEFYYEGSRVDRVIAHHDQLLFLGEIFEVRHVPGHAPGNILLYNANDGIAFVGDVIFSGSIGRYDLPGSNFEVLKNSIQSQIYTLPPETILYSGHGPTTTVKKEKLSNPYVRG